MAKEALLKVVEAEKEAEEVVRRAGNMAKERIAKAEKSAREYLEESKRNAVLQGNSIKDQAREDISFDIERINSESEARCKAIRGVSQEKIDEAKRVLIERIVK